MPKYGDSTEYLELAQTLSLPSYRPFVYPYMLNMVSKIANWIHVNITYIVYFIQIIINIVAYIVLIHTIKEIFNIRINKKEWILYTLFIFSIPINMHFNMSIKCDSLSTSFTILFIASLIKYRKTEKYRFAIFSLITMFIVSSIRSEKIYFLTFVIVGVIIIELVTYWYHKKTSQLNKKKILMLFLILILGTTSTNIAKEIFQNKDDADTSESTIFLYAYERIIGNTLPNIYEYLPDDVKQNISYEEAVESASSKNNYKLPYQKLLEEDGNLGRASKILKTAIRRNFPNIK